MRARVSDQEPTAGVIPFPVAGLPTSSKAEEVLSALYGRLSEKLAEYAAHYVSRDEADDVVQQAFVELWQRHLTDDREPKASYEAMLFQSVRFRVMDYRRTTRRRRFALDFWNYSDTLKNMARRWMEPHSAVEVDDFNKAINGALDAMPPRTRELQVLYRKAGLSVDEVAAATGLARETVRALLQRGNRILRDHLDRAGYSPESRRGASGKGIRS